MPEGIVPAPEGEAAAPEQRQERGPRGERGERGDRGQRAERRERGDRGERRGERGPREGAPTEEADALAGAAGSVGAVMETPEAQLPPGANAVLESHTHFDEPRPEGEQRERRSRDRYGRDRRERGDRAAEAVVATGAEVSPAEMEVFAGHAPLPQEHHAGGGRAAAPAQAPAAPEAIRTHAVPRVQPFRLPVDELKDVAEGSGLQWVLSDADKIAAAQAAMAAEPKPVHVPRERPPVVVIDEGPLVLVETKRDLRNLQLPF